MNATFWSLILEPGKRYEKLVDNGIHVTRATLDTLKASPDAGIVQVILEYNGSEMTVANLSMKHNIFQTKLELMFNGGEKIAFSCAGATVPVTLTGLAGTDDMSDEDEDEEDSLLDSSTLNDSDEEPELVPAGKKRKIQTPEKSSKAAKLSDGARKNKELTLNGESFMSDDDSDHSYNPMLDLNDSKAADLPDEDEEDVDDEEDSDDDNDETEEMGEEDDSDEDDDEEDSDDDDDDDDEEFGKEELQKLALGLAERNKKRMNAQAEAQKKESSNTPRSDKKAKVVKESKSGKETTTPVKEAKAAMKEEKATPHKKQGKISKKDKVVNSVDTPKSEKAANKENINKTPKQDKKKLKEGKKAEKTPMGKANGEPSTQKTPKHMKSGGVMVEDVLVGSGSEAKQGQLVSVFYEGRLKNNGRTFDKIMSGPPFKFRLGRGEVIKGWDVGVAGMKVGGRRKIVVPPNMGYGKQGAPPAIPPNATLNFEVTLLGCH